MLSLLGSLFKLMDVAGAVKAPGYEWTTPAREDWLLRLPLPLPRIHTSPWWFLVQELRIPGVFSPETGLADLIFGPDRAIVLEMEWMIQALLTGGRSLSGNLVEITIYGWPAQRRESMLPSLELRHGEHRAQGESLRKCACRGSHGESTRSYLASFRPVIFP